MARFNVYDKNENKELTNEARVIDIAKKLIILAYDEEDEDLSSIDLERAKSIIEKYGGRVVSLPIKDINN